MKKIIIAFFASVFLLGASSCTDPYADELYDLQTTDPEDGPGGEVSPDPEDNPPPSSSD